MATKGLAIAVILAIVIVGKGSYSNYNFNNYNSNYGQRPVFMFRPKLPQNALKPITLADLIALFDATGYTDSAWASAATVISLGRAEVETALGSYPANAHTALQGLANAPPGVAQQFLSLGNQFNQISSSLELGMNNMIPELFALIDDVVNNDIDPGTIPELTKLFDVLHYTVTVLFNIKVQVSSGTQETVKQSIAGIHSTMAQFLDHMNQQMATVVSFALPKEKMISSLQLIHSKVMQFEVKPCSAPICVDLSQLLPAVKDRAQDALDLYQP